MSIGSWDPSLTNKKDHSSIDQQLLQRFIHLSETEQLDQLHENLSSEDIQHQAQLMQLDKAQWLSTGNNYSDHELEQLMRFFTVAENLPGWVAGDNSPVIWLGKILKERGTGINKDLVIWIKANTENRFLPHGALL